MPKTPPFAEFKQRLFTAQKRYELKVGRTLDRDELAAKVGKAVKWGKPFSRGTVSQWFLGNQMPSVEQLEAIAKVLGCSPAWLAFGQTGEIITPDGEVLPASGGPPTPEPHHRSQRGRK
jgi:transcriptional regulator with XRE-family HTH domain